MFRRKRRDTCPSNELIIPKHKSMMSFSTYTRSLSVGGESDKPLPSNISVSVPTSPRDDSINYCKAVSTISLRLSERRKEEEIRKLTSPPAEESSDSDSDEYYSAYYEEDSKSSNQDSSELGNLEEGESRLNGNIDKLLTNSPRNSSFQNLPSKPPNNLYNKDIKDSLEEPKQFKDEPIPQLRLPKKRKKNYATLSQLKNPCSPRLLESRDLLEEANKAIELQKMLFELRVTFWKIENSREHAIKKYISLASKAGFIICENCKRLLRDQELVKKKGNYHIKRHSRRQHEKIYYKCTSKSYDQYFITTPAGKFFPLSFEK